MGCWFSGVGLEPLVEKVDDFTLARLLRHRRRCFAPNVAARQIGAEFSQLFDGFDVSVFRGDHHGGAAGKIGCFDGGVECKHALKGGVVALGGRLIEQEMCEPKGGFAMGEVNGLDGGVFINDPLGGFGCSGGGA